MLLVSFTRWSPGTQPVKPWVQPARLTLPSLICLVKPPFFLFLPSLFGVVLSSHWLPLWLLPSPASKLRICHIRDPQANMCCLSFWVSNLRRLNYSPVQYYFNSRVFTVPRALHLGYITSSPYKLYCLQIELTWEAADCNLLHWCKLSLFQCPVRFCVLLDDRVKV